MARKKRYSRNKAKILEEEIDVKVIQQKTSEKAVRSVDEMDVDLVEDNEKKEKQIVDLADDKDGDEKSEDAIAEEKKTPTKTRKSLDGKESEIRFGALEIMAAYTGTEEEGSVPYSFVILTSDITYGDEDTDVTNVQWLELSLKGTLCVDGESEIAIGSFICPVTNEIIHHGNGSYQVPEVVHTMVKNKLERQLADDYDPEKDDEDEIDYETRMTNKKKLEKTQAKTKKLGRKKKRDADETDLDPVGTTVKTESSSPRKRGRKTKKEDDSDVEMEDLDFKEDNNEDDDLKMTKQPTKKKQKTNGNRNLSKKASTSSKKKKLQLEPRVDLEIVENPWFRSGKADFFNGDTHRASKEVIRSYLSKDKKVFQQLLKDTKNVADIFAEQSCDLGKNVYDYAILNEDEEAVEILVKEMKAKTHRAPFPVCSLFQFSSGSHTSKHVARHYNVGASRGGKEGNNAFTNDMFGHSSYSKGQSEPKKDIVELLRTHDSVSIDFFNYFDKEVYDGNLVTWGFNFHKLVCFGHQELAQHAMKTLLNRDVGLNNLHVDCLGPGHTLEKFRTVSVEKKSSADAGVRFCPVHCAASNSNPTYLQQLLKIKPEAVNCVDSEEAGLLHYAAVGKSSDTLKWLLDGPGTSLNRNLKLRKGDKTTPLMWAARTCRADNIRLLCDEGKYEKTPEMLKILDGNGLSALHHVAQSNRASRLEAAKALIDCGADPNMKGDARLQNKQTPLMFCAAKGDLNLLKMLYDVGGDPLLTDKLGKTPLMLSVKNGNIHVASYLLKIGVNVDAEDSSGNTALHYACAYGWSDCVKLLTQVGADINASNSWMTTPLELALKKGRFACAIILLKLKADVNVIDRNGVSLFNSLVTSYLDQLSQKNELPLPWAIKKIMERDDLDIKTTDKSGQTLLHYIAKVTTKSELLLNMVKTLIGKGADPLIVDKDGQPPAIVALKHNNLRLSSYLLENSSHAEIMKNHDENLMHILMQNIVEIEYEFFMNLFNHLNKLNPTWLDSFDDSGMTPLMTATRAVRSKWVATNGKGKEILGELFKSYPDQFKKERSRVIRFREWNHKLIRNGEPNWKPKDEYEDGSRLILHELLQCPDIGWVLQTCEKYSNYFKRSHFTLKTNSGYDSIGYALDTFVRKDVPVESILKLIILLKDNGAQMNNVMHPLFNSLNEAETIEPILKFEGLNRNLEEASAFVHSKERLRIKTLLIDKDKRSSVHASKFQSRLHWLMRREGDRRPSPELLKKLIKECDFDPDIRDRDGNTILHTVTDMNYVRCLIPFSNINALNRKGESPLILAVEDIARLKLFIESGANVDLVSEKGTALHIATLNGNNDAVTILLKTCNVNIKDQHGQSPLHIAVSNRAISTKDTLNPIESQLLLAGADINAIDNHGRSPLHYCFFPIHTDTKCNFPPAPKRDPIDMLTILASSTEIDFGVKDEDERSPLHYAAAVGASICVLLLCDKCETTLNSRDMDDNTPLGLSILAGRADTSILLISKGSNVDVSVTKASRFRKDGKIYTTTKEIGSTLKIALQIKSCESVARYILASEKLSILTVLNALFSTGKFQLAMNQINMCQSGTLRGVSKDDGMTALHYLATAKSFATAKGFANALGNVLVQRGVPALSKCYKGRTILHLASMHGHFELCRLFIRKFKVSVDEKDSYGDTALSLMFKFGTPSQELLFLLIEASENKKAFVNECVKSHGDRNDDEHWKKLSSLENILFATPKNMRHGKEDFICLLEEEKLPANSVKESKYEIKSTTLIESVKLKDPSMVNILLSYGVHGNNTDQNGRTALHHAIISNNLEMVSLILKWNRVPLDHVDKFGFSALSYSILQSLECASSPTIFYELLAYGADPTQGQALNIAIKANMEEMVLSMFYCVKIQCIGHGSEIETPPKIGDLVLTRYSELSTVWSLAKVSDIVESSYSVIPCSDTVQKSEVMVTTGSPRLSTFSDNQRTNASSTTASYEDRSKDIITNITKSDETTIQMYKTDNVSDTKEFPIKLQILLSGPADAKDSLSHFESSSRTKKSLEICGIPPSCLCLYDGKSDVTRASRDMMLHYMNTSLSESDKIAKLKQYAGAEMKLLKEILHGKTLDSLTTELQKGDKVGYLQNSKHLYVGEITNVHQNGKYDIILFNGQTLEMVNRMNLRALSNDLQLDITRVNKHLDFDLIHDLIEPMESISFDNINILLAMIDVGINVHTKNAKGKTPVEILPVHSAIRQYLCECTKMQTDLPISTKNSLQTTGIDFQADADAEYQALLAAESSNTERIIPKIIPVCKNELDQDSAENYVLEENGAFYDVSLTKVDVMQGQYGKYDFYRMQIAYLPLKNAYVLLTNWGRIGDYGGGKYQQTPYTDKKECIKEFQKVFKSKTGNLWEYRNEFIKQPKKYRLVNRPKQRLKNPEKLLGEALIENHPCSLPQSVAKLLRFSLNIKSLETAFHASEIDHDRLPFGQLTLSTIQQAERKLEEIKDSLKERNELKKKGNTDINDFRKAIEATAVITNEFYELLPMGGDTIVTPFEENDHRFQQAAKLIVQLRDLTVAKQLLMGSRYRQTTTNPIDYVYNALGIEITPVEMKSIEGKVLMQYIDNTCNVDEVIIEKIYSLDDGKKSCDIPNKKLLFHGSGNENVLGILKDGLLIAPPGASRCGNAYGDGVYFSDQFSKAYGYTSGLSQDCEPRCFVFVAEVALGESYIPASNNYIKITDKAPQGKDSTHARGSSEPKPAYDIMMTSTGEIVPLGKLKPPEQQKKYIWVTKPYGPNSYSQYLQAEESMKIEKVRTDPATKFPAQVVIKDQYTNNEQTVTLYGPDAETATMGEQGVSNGAMVLGEQDMDANMENEENQSDEEMEDEDERDIRMSSFGNSTHLINGSSQSDVKTLYRESILHSGCCGGASEFIVYDTNQIRLKYLLEITSKSSVKAQLMK